MIIFVFFHMSHRSIFSLPQPMMTNSDLGRLLKAFEIQSVLRPPMYVEFVLFDFSNVLK